MNKKITITGVYSLLHALVDMSCAVLFTGVLMNSGYPARYGALAVLAYDFFAFVLQFPFGMIADKLNRNALVSALGCVLVGVAFAFRMCAFPACIVAGVGNALFHVGGGVDVLNVSEGKASLSGIYVSTGAMGLYLGIQWYHKGYLIPCLAGALAAGTLLLIWLFRKIRRDYKVDNAECEHIFGLPELTSEQHLIVVCLLLTVCVRSCLGMVMNFTWKSGFYTGLAAVAAVVLGKACGGIIGDRLGWKRTSVTSLVIAAVLFYPAFDSMICGLLALFFFNMTMPITLTAMANLFPKRMGAAFGVTSAALFFGAAPVFIGYSGALFQRPVLVGATFASAVVLFCGLWYYGRLKKASE
ncbi:MAG: hypothetical protein IJL03_11345 [Lachnospiraceae bacterium]|nr:hypothetical protein [Lachnospiraceae bacterium]